MHFNCWIFAKQDLKLNIFLHNEMELQPETSTLILGSVTVTFHLLNKAIRVAGSTDFEYCIVSQEDIDDDRFEFIKSSGGAIEVKGDTRPLFLALRSERDVEIIVRAVTLPTPVFQSAAPQPQKEITSSKGVPVWIWYVVIAAIVLLLMRKK